MKPLLFTVPLQAYVCGASLLHIPASGKWDGLDGPWSTFSIVIETPQQKLRLLPSFFGTSLTPIDGDLCQNTSCPSDAELLYFKSSSSTWDRISYGTGSTPLGYQYKDWFYRASSTWGKDNIVIKEGDGMSRDIANSSFVTPIFNFANLSTGMLGLSNGPNSIGPGVTIASLLTQLNEAGTIDSATWSYTAGSGSINANGSLVLNGYDLTHINRKAMLTISDRDLSTPSGFYVWLQNVGYQEGSLLTQEQSTQVYLNSDVGQIWLSYQVCKNFEIAYGLVWNETYQYYLLDDAQHDKMKRDNFSLYFRIQPSQGHKDSIEIEVPYHAMDLQVNINGSLHYYYPIRPTRFTNQYVLGRAFFQAAYIIVNYGNKSLEVGQARFPSSHEAPQLQPIEVKRRQHRSVGEIAGGTVAGVIVLLLAISILMWRRKTRSQREKLNLVEPAGPTFATLLHGSHKPELAATPTVPPPAYRKRLWSNATTASEVDGIDTMLTSRLDCLREELSEVPEKYSPDELVRPLVELEGSSLSPAELDAGFQGFEAAESVHPAPTCNEATTSNDNEQDEFASRPLAMHQSNQDEPVSPLASRSESRASK